MYFYEDDICLVLWSKNYEDIVDKTDEAISILRDTFSDLGLGFVDNMTYIMIFGVIIEDQIVTIIEDGIELQHLDYYITVNTKTRDITLTNLTELAQLDYTANTVDTVAIPSSLLNFGSAKGLEWTNALRENYGISNIKMQNARHE
ncbi:unnamed protein product [Oikopleura dioica]|uniref:Uncharacterized protein n=1 Tax=Oikopleura dioica TaxID=34765 RepID=E4YXZ5_OIKDI|nr:unnamed protein product [Oikopleura dioica]